VIRVNLLPSKRETRSGEGSQAWLGVVLGVLFLEAVGLFVFHQSKLSELAAQRRKNQEITNQAAEIDRKVANHEVVKQELAALRKREEAIATLQAGRSGPTGVLLELAQVLTPGRGPTVDADRLAQLRRDDPTAVPNAAWDARRLWLASYKELEQTVTIDGFARDGEDVSELARRLALSRYFADVRLLPATKSIDPETKLDMRKFQLQARVRY
jgi:type IV pilus assembly protein PilN